MDDDPLAIKFAENLTAVRRLVSELSVRKLGFKRSRQREIDLLIKQSSDDLAQRPFESGFMALAAMHALKGDRLQTLNVLLLGVLAFPNSGRSIASHCLELQDPKDLLAKAVLERYFLEQIASDLPEEAKNLLRETRRILFSRRGWPVSEA